jgi:hypothetical protein
MAKVKKMMKKSAPKKAMMKKAPAKAMPMQAPPMQQSPMAGGPMMKKGGKIKKYQNAPKPVKKSLPLGASSASAESDYAKSDSLKNVVNKMSGKEWFDRTAKGNSPMKLRIQSDSLKAEGDKKTKATGGVTRDMRLKKGGAIKKVTMKKGGKMSKSKKC